MVARILAWFWQGFRHSRGSVSRAYSDHDSCVKPVHFIARMSMVRWINAGAAFIERRRTGKAKKSLSMCKGIGHIHGDRSRH
jgi:hypothetical protein